MSFQKNKDKIDITKEITMDDEHEYGLKDTKQSANHSLVAAVSSPHSLFSFDILSKNGRQQCEISKLINLL